MRFQDLFRGYTRFHGASRARGTKDSRGKAEFDHFTKAGPPTEKEWEGHLSGKGHGLGIIPLMDDNVSVSWGAIDIDRYPLDHAQLEKDCENLPLVITKSKSGGAHLWLFLQQPTNAQLVTTKLGEWAAALGFGSCEVFPKQYKRIADDDIGNWINLPYYGNTRLCVFKGKEIGIDEFVEVAQKRSLTEEQLKNIQVIDDESGDFQDGPPCLQVLAQIKGINQGNRNNGLFNVGVYFRAKYGEDDPEKWGKYLYEWNRENVDPMLPEHELGAMIKSIDRKGFNYSCHKAPIEQHCNRKVCLKREYGVARGGAGDKELNVVFEGLTKVKTSKPRWLVNIDQVRVDLGETEVLLNQNKCAVLVLEKLNKLMNNIPNDKWKEQINKLLEHVEEVDAPFDASPEGQFLIYLDQYVQSRITDVKDQIAMGNVWVDGNKAYFKSTEFFQYLRREGFREIEQSKAFVILHGLGLERGRFNIKGKTVAWWSVNLEKLNMEKLQDQAYSVPEFGENVFGEDNEQ